MAMKFSVGVPNCREGYTLPVGIATTEGMAKMAQAADRLNFYSIFADDFTAPSPKMKLPPGDPPNWHEALLTLSYLAYIAKNVRLAVGVIVAPLREPVLLAKQVATLDVLSNGRLILGVGLGGFRDEFERVHPRRRDANRGRMIDEMLEAMELLLYRDQTSYRGQYYEFDEVTFYPKPVQKKVPIYFHVSKSEAIMRRIARWGDGWLIVSTNPEEIRQTIDAMSPLLHEAGRSLPQIDISSYGVMSLARTRKEALERYQRSLLSHRTQGLSEEQIIERHFIGTPREIVDRVGRLQEAGVTHCVASTFAVDSVNEMLEQVEILGSEVLPSLE